MDENNVFPTGIFFKSKRDKAPDWVRGHLSFKVEEAIKYLQEKKNANGYVDIDILKSKAGSTYLKLNTFEPKKKDEKPL